MGNTSESFPQEIEAFAGRWLVLIVQLPAKPDYLRVKLRRRIQRVGALSLKGAVYVLPNRADTLEDLVWLRGELIADGGDAIVCSARTVVGITDAALEARFDDLRATEYREIIDTARALRSMVHGDETARELARLRRRFEEIVKLDFFGSSAQQDARRVLEDLAAASNRPGPAQDASPTAPALEGQTWVTRAGVFVDRIASAWLIRRFIDPRGVFKFTTATSYSPLRGELRFDMYQAEYTHDGQHCTFETLLDRFRLDEPALRSIAEIVHDIDCKDEKFARPEAAGVELVLRGLVSAEPDDARRLDRGAAIFDGLFSQLTGASAES
jgi:hypothetical protein